MEIDGKQISAVPCDGVVLHQDGCPVPNGNCSCYETSTQSASDVDSAPTGFARESLDHERSPTDAADEVSGSSNALPVTNGLFVEALKRARAGRIGEDDTTVRNPVEASPKVGEQLPSTVVADRNLADVTHAHSAELERPYTATEEHDCVDVSTAPGVQFAEAAREDAAAAAAATVAAVSRLPLQPCCYASLRIAEPPRSNEGQAAGSLVGGSRLRRPLLELDDSDLVDIVNAAFQPLLEWPRFEVQAMEHRLAAGLTPSNCAYPVTLENWTKVFAMILSKVELMGKHVLHFILACPGIEIIPKDIVVKIATEGFYGMLLLLESPLYLDGDSHLMLEDGSVFSRDWMRLSLEEHWLDAEHEFASHQAEVNLSIPETALVCLVHLLSCGSYPAGVSMTALDFIRERVVGALVFEINRNRVDAQHALSDVTALLDHLRSLTHKQAGLISKAFYEAGINPELCKVKLH